MKNTDLEKLFKEKPIKVVLLGSLLVGVGLSFAIGVTIALLSLWIEIVQFAWTWGGLL